MTSRSLILITSIAAALAAPLAFAQSDTSATATTATSQDSTSAQASMQATTSSPPEAAITGSATAAKKVSWSDLDGDKDGKLTRAEAAGVTSLSTVFDKADADKDGALTPDEYKAYVATSGSADSNGS